MKEPTDHFTIVPRNTEGTEEAFLRVPLDVARRKDLTPAAKLVYAYLVTRGRLKGWTFYKTKIAEEIGIGRRTVYDCLDQLVQKSLIDGQKLHTPLQESHTPTGKIRTLQEERKEDLKEEYKKRSLIADQLNSSLSLGDRKGVLEPKEADPILEKPVIDLPPNPFQGSSPSGVSGSCDSDAVLGQVETADPVKGSRVCNADPLQQGQQLRGEAELRRAIEVAQASKRINEAIGWGKPVSMDDFDKIFGKPS